MSYVPQRLEFVPAGVGVHVERFFAFHGVEDDELVGEVWSVGLGGLTEFRAPPPRGLSLDEAVSLARQKRLVARLDQHRLLVDRWSGGP